MSRTMLRPRSMPMGDGNTDAAVTHKSGGKKQPASGKPSPPVTISSDDAR